MAEFNLVVHGFVLIDEISTTEWEICVPDMATHAYMYGQVRTVGDVELQTCDKAGLRIMAPGNGQVTISGHQTPPLGMKDLLSIGTELALKKAQTQRTGQRTRNVIRVPRPNLVRSFRGFEVPQNKPVIQNPAQRRFALAGGNPRVMYETTVFRYTGLPPGGTVSLWSWQGRLVNGVALNLGIYSQSPTDDGEPGGAMPGPHGDEVNDMITFSGQRPTLDLATIAIPDAAHHTSIGIRRCELLNLRELFGDVFLADSFVCGRCWMAME